MGFVTRRRFAWGVVAAAIVAALVAGLIASPARAQGDPPNLFFGPTDDLLVDGAAYDGSTPIEVLDANGAVVGVAAIADGFWSVQVSASVGEIHFRIGDAVSATIAPQIGGISSILVTLVSSGTPPPIEGVTPMLVPATRTLSLSAGTNTVGYSGSSAVDPSVIQDALANPSALDAIFYWNGASQSWQSWRPTAPSFLNDLTSVTPNMSLFLIMTAATTIELEVGGYGGGAWNLVTGFTTVTFLGDDGTSTADALASVARLDSIEALFYLDAATGTFKSYRPSGPAFLNDLLTLNRFDVLFVLANGATSWSYPAFAL